MFNPAIFVDLYKGGYFKSQTYFIFPQDIFKYLSNNNKKSNEKRSNIILYNVLLSGEKKNGPFKFYTEV